MNKFDTDLTCTLCNSGFEEPVVVARCCHIYCKDCIETWSHESNSCPQCKGEIEDFSRNNVVTKLAETAISMRAEIEKAGNYNTAELLIESFRETEIYQILSDRAEDIGISKANERESLTYNEVRSRLDSNALPGKWQLVEERNRSKFDFENDNERENRIKAELRNKKEKVLKTIQCRHNAQSEQVALKETRRNWQFELEQKRITPIPDHDEVFPDAVKRMSRFEEGKGETMIEKCFMKHQSKETHKEREQRLALELQQFYDSQEEKTEKALTSPVLYAQPETHAPKEDHSMNVKDRLEERFAQTEKDKAEAVPIHFKENEEQLKQKKNELLILRKQIQDEQRFKLKQERKKSNC